LYRVALSSVSKTQAVLSTVLTLMLSVLVFWRLGVSKEDIVYIPFHCFVVAYNLHSIWLAHRCVPLSSKRTVVPLFAVLVFSVHLMKESYIAIRTGQYSEVVMMGHIFVLIYVQAIFAYYGVGTTFESPRR